MGTMSRCFEYTSAVHKQRAALQLSEQIQWRIVQSSNPATPTRPLNPFTLRTSPQFADQRGLFAERVADVEQVHGCRHCMAVQSVITGAAMTARITIRRPDDWHLHVRDGDMLKAVLPYTAKDFGRAILMPNLTPPVRTTRDAMAYRERVEAALPPGSRFQPLMTCYLTDHTDAGDVERGFRDGVFTGVKLYPANATTNSAAGVTDHRNISRVLERMEKIDMPFLMHGEEVGPDIDIFDREAVFIDRRLSQWVKQFPGLRMILEHLSTQAGAEFVVAFAG